MAIIAKPGETIKTVCQCCQRDINITACAHDSDICYCPHCAGPLKGMDFTKPLDLYAKELSLKLESWIQNGRDPMDVELANSARVLADLIEQRVHQEFSICNRSH